MITAEIFDGTGQLLYTVNYQGFEAALGVVVGCLASIAFFMFWRFRS